MLQQSTTSHSNSYSRQGFSSTVRSSKPTVKVVPKKELVRGEFKGLCKTSSCSKSTAYYNSLTGAWYCEKCAVSLEKNALAVGMSYFKDLPEEKLTAN